jgi:hypothetical protein
VREREREKRERERERERYRGRKDKFSSRKKPVVFQVHLLLLEKVSTLYISGSVLSYRKGYDFSSVFTNFQISLKPQTF